MADAPSRRRFGPDRIALVPVTVFLFGSLPVAASSRWLTWVLLLPLGCGVWVWRARVVAARVGLEVCNGLGAQRIAWADVEGFDVPERGPVRLLRAGARPLPMTALARRDLPRLLEIGTRAASAPPTTSPPTTSPPAPQPPAPQPPAPRHPGSQPAG